MNKVILVKIIMPSQVVFEVSATMVNIPGDEGMIGILPGHMKLITTVKVGIINVFAREVESKIFVYGGIAQITSEEVNIVTEFASIIGDQTKEDIVDKITILKSELEINSKNRLEFEIINANINKYNSLLQFTSS